MEFFKVKISKDKLAVDIDFFPLDENDLDNLSDVVLSKLHELDITDINTNAIQEALVKVVDTNNSVLDVNVAKGIPSENGKDAWVDYYVKTEQDFRPKTTKDGGVDFHELSVIEFVEENQKLALYHPPEDGEDGIDVFGKTISSIKGKSTSLPGGENTRPSPENKNLYVAKTAGVVSVKQGVVNVNPVYTIKGDVDFHTGNINNKGAIVIKGDVKSGFEVESSDKIEIDGCVEDAVIKSCGDIVIKRGFVGTGNGTIHSKGNVNIAFVRNQSVFSDQSILVAREVVDSNLYAGKKIQVGGRKMSIIGGYSIAGEEIEVETLGNEYEATTKVEVGYDYRLDEEIKNNNLIIADLEEELKKINMDIQKLQRWNSIPSTDQKLVAFKERQTEIVLLLKHLPEENQKLEKKRLTPSKAFVKVKQLVYPGVEIIINRQHFHVQEKMRGKTFVLSDQNQVTVLK